jgi:hypothetical protein
MNSFGGDILVNVAMILLVLALGWIAMMCGGPANGRNTLKNRPKRLDGKPWKDEV